MIPLLNRVVAALTRYNTISYSLGSLLLLSILLFIVHASRAAWFDALFLSAWGGTVGLAGDTSRTPLVPASIIVFIASICTATILFGSSVVLSPHAVSGPNFVLSVLAASCFVFVTSMFLGRVLA